MAAILRNKKIKKVLLAGYVALLAAIGGYLFFGEYFVFNTPKITSEEELRGASYKLVIGYAFAPQSLEPTLFDAITRSHLVDIYEGLVKTDRNLKITSGVAVSWGLLDPLTWEFTLRPGVKFHDGTLVHPKDVVASIERAQTFEQSQLKSLLYTIEKVEVMDDQTILIHTSVPDPLLLQKMAVTYIFPRTWNNFELPMGTGPYQFISRDEFRLVLHRFKDYWGDKPAYTEVVLQYIAHRNDRVAALEKAEIQLLTNVPPNVGCATSPKYKAKDGCLPLSNKDIVITSIPSLEVNFLGLNVNDEFFGDRKIRKALMEVFDADFFVDLAYGFAKPAGQFVSSGVFGFDPELKKPLYDLENAKAALREVLASQFDRVTITFDYPESADAVGEYVKSQLEELGIGVILNPLSDQALQQKVLAGETDMYFLGWRSELGDAIDFLTAVAHSRTEGKGYGLYNGSAYKNAEVDGLIESGQENLDMEKRLHDLQQAMKILVEEDILAIPLYEAEIIYAYQKNIHFEPRVDGYVHASEIY